MQDLPEAVLGHHRHGLPRHQGPAGHVAHGRLRDVREQERDCCPHCGDVVAPKTCGATPNEENLTGPDRRSCSHGWDAEATAAYVLKYVAPLQRYGGLLLVRAPPGRSILPRTARVPRAPRRRRRWLEDHGSAGENSPPQQDDERSGSQRRIAPPAPPPWPPRFPRCRRLSRRRGPSSCRAAR